jgi:hypothetical protein
MRPMRVDTSRFPLVYATIDGKQTRDDLEHYLGELEALNLRGERFGLVTDIRDYAVELSHAKRFGEWSRDNEDRTAKLCVGASVVIPSDLIRIMFSAFYLVAQVRFPFTVSKTLPRAESWVSARLAEAGLRPGSGS